MKVRYNNLINSKAFTNPAQNIQNNYLRLDGNIKQLENLVILKKKEAEKNFQTQISKLDALSPLKTLARGFSITQKDGKMIKSSKKLQVNDEINIVFLDGNKYAKIIEK